MASPKRRAKTDDALPVLANLSAYEWFNKVLDEAAVVEGEEARISLTVQRGGGILFLLNTRVEIWKP